MKTRNKIIATATAELGTKESPPKSNRTKYGAWYGFDGYAWCAQFVSWVFNQAGVPLGKIDDAKGYRACHSAYLHFKATGQITTTPQPGDIVIFDWTGDGHCDHTGIFHSWIKQGEIFYCIEGNTSLSDNSNGGEVMQRKRSVQSVKAFVLPKVLGGTPVVPSDTLSKGDRNSDIAVVQKLLYDLGYQITVDGLFGPQTERIVKQFQKDQSLTQDGIVTPSLRGLLEQAVQKKQAPDAKVTNGSFLKKGSVGAAVVALQKALIKKGADITDDGVFGDMTKEAVLKFQKQNGLVADGIAGPQTFAALGINI